MTFVVNFCDVRNFTSNDQKLLHVYMYMYTRKYFRPILLKIGMNFEQSLLLKTANLGILLSVHVRSGRFLVCFTLLK